MEFFKKGLTDISQTVHSSKTILVDHHRICTHWENCKEFGDRKDKPKMINRNQNHYMRIIAVIDATFAVAKRKPEKIQACTRFEPLTSAIPTAFNQLLS